MKEDNTETSPCKQRQQTKGKLLSSNTSAEEFRLLSLRLWLSIAAAFLIPRLPDVIVLGFCGISQK
jgi:hypothetical protein